MIATLAGADFEEIAVGTRHVRIMPDVLGELAD